MVNWQNTIVVLTIVVLNINLVSTTSCFCTSRDFVVPVDNEYSQVANTSFVFYKNACFAGMMKRKLFCPVNQPFCFNLADMHATSCGELVQSDSTVPSWGQWSNWRECIASGCGEYGIRTRERECLPKSDSDSCKGDKAELDTCFKNCTQHIVQWSAWSSWSPCEDPCILSSMSNRTRVCPASDVSICAGNAVEYKNCTVDGQWSEWGAWVGCLASFSSSAIEYRQRACDSPSPTCGGKDCEGTKYEYHKCSEVYGWAEWSAWGSCIQTAGVDIQFRNRTCREKGCDGSNFEYNLCPQPKYTVWGSWSMCSVTCGTGVHTRRRLCLEVVESSDSLTSTNTSSCVGQPAETEPCIDEICEGSNMPVWSEWSAWSTCDRPCDTGSSLRFRTCLDKKNGCQGLNEEKINCGQSLCNIDGGWAAWEEWSQCHSVKDFNVIVRQRHCMNPAPKNSGKDCAGDNYEIGYCRNESSWGEWVDIGHCYKTGDDGNTTGLQYRNRTCHVGLSKNPCQGTDEESQQCSLKGVWSEWGNWSTCSETCGLQGMKQRVRQCIDADERECAGSGIDKQTCKEDKTCPIDGKFSEWSAWSTCPVTCNGGPVTRSRLCDSPSPQFGGKPCEGETTQTSVCNTQLCPVDGGWSDWQDWSNWVTKCPKETRSRTRNCDNPAPQNGGHNCTGDQYEYESKDIHNCPIDGGWSEWSAWFGCSATCGLGINKRYRACNNPVPANHGKPCPVDGFEDTASCKDIDCPVDGSWTEWGAWGDCSVTCSNGTRVKTRNCSNPEPMFNGKPCTGSSKETDECYRGNCPIDGSWTDWSPWYACSVTCGDGIKLRNRSCDNPAPQYNGSYCVGLPVGNDTCNNGHCPINGSWGSWLPWEACSVTCANGTKLRHRKCNNPEPQYGGVNCTGIDEESDTCYEGACPINGQWGSWVPWSRCAGDCQTGSKQRFRNCDNPPPQDGGDYCTGIQVEQTNCVPANCITDGSWGSWQSWEACSVTCENGVKFRHRACDSPAPMYGGANCTGIREESTSCNDGPCPTNGLWGPWVPWSRCSGTCPTGMKQRFRNCDSPSPRDGGKYCDGLQSETATCALQNCST